MENLIDIPGRLNSVAIEKHVAGTDQIYDDVLKTTLDILNLENITDVKVQDGKLQFLNIQGLVLKEISIASTTQKQSDWNLTDSTQVDFIKGKPTIYNKLEVDDKLITKQDTISDLDTIRSGASAGTTAYQKSQTGIPSSDMSSAVQISLGKADTALQEHQSLAGLVNTGSYNTVSKKIELKHDNTVLAEIDATAFIKDGMVDSVVVSNGYIVITFNTDAGKETIRISVTDIFDPSNYYDKDDVDGLLADKVDKIEGKGLSTNDYTDSDKGKLSALPTNSELATLLSGKVDKIVGKGLSTNDYSDTDKDKLTALPTASELSQQLGSKANSADLAEVATNGSYNSLSDKPDLSAFITKSVNDLTNYYLMSETYTKTEVQQLIGAIQQFHYEVYPTLPETGASNVLYLIGPIGTGADKYEEYVYANNDWTKIGDTSIDLSGYVTTQALNTALADYVTSSALSTILSNYVNKNEVDDVPTANSNNLVTSGGVYDALQGEYVVVTATADTGSVATAMVGIYDVNDVLIVEGEGEVTARILYGKTYKVKCSRVYDYLTPAEQTFVASIPSRQVTMQYTYIERDVVTLDQTISDSAQMLSGDIQGDVIKEIRSHSHLYLGTPATQSGDTEGTELLCQLSDEDSRLYYDGTPAALDGSEGDQWMKLPVFWWKIVGVGEAAADGAYDQYRFMFAFAGEPDPSWNKWQGDRNLVGAKEMKVIDGKGRSVSGGQSTDSFTQAQGNAYAEARNLGCQEVTWEWQWMMCMLCYAWNGDTNSQKTNGIGTNSYTRTLGMTDQLGMTDTTPAQATSLTSARFWGLEAWWNCKNEWLGNVVMENYVLSITDQDTKQTRQVSGFIQCGGTGGWNSRMRIDANGDFVPLAKAGTQTTYYCDWVNSNSGSRVLHRSNIDAYAYGGVADVYAYYAPSHTNASNGSRLAFNGVITEAESVAAYKAALA